MPFNPKSEYTIVPTEIIIKDFFDLKEDYVTRPPYQRKSVWSQKKKQGLMDSLFRRYYIPKLVIREVRLSDNQTVNEIIDGQQRITTVQEFFNNQYPLPKTLSDIDKNLPDKYFKDFDVDTDISKRQTNPIYRKGTKACHDKSNLKEADHDKAIINRATEAETGIMEAAHK